VGWVVREWGGCVQREREERERENHVCSERVEVGVGRVCGGVGR